MGTTGLTHKVAPNAGDDNNAVAAHANNGFDILRSFFFGQAEVGTERIAVTAYRSPADTPEQKSTRRPP
jgi:hypothetical protein